jgi:hypothetical protein
MGVCVATVGDDQRELLKPISIDDIEVLFHVDTGNALLPRHMACFIRGGRFSHSRTAPLPLHGRKKTAPEMPNASAKQHCRCDACLGAGRRRSDTFSPIEAGRDQFGAIVPCCPSKRWLAHRPHRQGITRGAYPEGRSRRDSMTQPHLQSDRTR